MEGKVLFSFRYGGRSGILKEMCYKRNMCPFFILNDHMTVHNLKSPCEETNLHLQYNVPK